MVIEIDRKATILTIKNSLRRLHNNRTRNKQPNIAKFFGVLPNIGDGLEFQKSVRNEWD